LVLGSIGADREMQRVTGPQAERVLIGKPRGGADLPRPQLGRKRRGKLRRHPIADREKFRILVSQPALHALGLCLVRQCCDEHRRIEIEVQ
jgi:hypothetical protein